MKRAGIRMPCMDTAGLLSTDTVARENVEAKRHRVTREAGELAQARASAAAGRVVDSEAVKAWIDSIGTEQELPVPYTGR